MYSYDDFIFATIKNVFISIFVVYIFIKIRGEEELNIKNKFIVLISSLIGALLCGILNAKINSVYIIIINTFVQCIICKNISTINSRAFISSVLISSAIAHINFVIATFIESIARIAFSINSNILNLILILIIEAILNVWLFKIKRLHKGLQFLKEKINNEYLDIIMINISIGVIFIYSLFGTYYGDVTIHIAVTFLIISAIMIVMTSKTMNLAYKQKQLVKNLAEDDKIIKEKDEEIEKISKEKFEISKLNHEFEKRQKALELKINELIRYKTNTEISIENDILEQINNLSSEYSNKLKEIKKMNKLDETGIAEIDNMLKYIQNESFKEEIEFNLHINCDVNKLVNNIIPKNKLETLIGDIGTDAIIAVKHSSNKYKSIVTLIDKKDEIYSISVADTGIEFEIDTLLKLGLEPATTHKDEGGSGIGFITTFETLKETKASLIIEEKNEMTEHNYTKNIIIKFDGKNNYIIRSYRANEIKKKVKDDRIIIEQL